MTTKKKADDVDMIGPVISPGVRLGVRTRDGVTKVGGYCEVRDGQPIPEGVDVLNIDDDSACECGTWRRGEVVYRSGEQPATASGPAQVATPKYRSGYDRIFGKKPTVGLA